VINLSRLRRVALFLLVAALAAAGTVACNSAPPTPTPVPTITPPPPPTPTPVPVKSLRIDPAKDPAGFLAALPVGEVECAVKAIGTREHLVLLISGKTEPSAEQAAAIGRCVSKSTVLAVLAGQVELASGPLSDKTLSCIAGRAENLNFDTLIAPNPGPEGLVGLMQALFCLDKSERAALEQNGQRFALAPGRIDTMECFLNAAGPANLVSAFEFLQSGKGQPSPALIGAVLKCGLIPTTVPAPRTTPVLPGTPTPAGPGTVQPAASPTPAIALPTNALTPEQLACVTEKAGPQAAAALQSGAMSPAQLLPLLGVAAQCNIDLNKLLATPAPK
jgi:hypothetical protein